MVSDVDHCGRAAAGRRKVSKCFGSVAAKVAHYRGPRSRLLLLICLTLARLRVFAANVHAVLWERALPAMTWQQIHREQGSLPQVFWRTTLKILVRNLAREVTQPELLALFEAHGRVQSCTIVMDEVTGGSKGFGFANMPVPHEAKAAVKALNGLEVGGSKMRVKKAEAVAESKKTAMVADDGSESAAPVAIAESVPGPKIKKDGTPLGGKKVRTFRKKKS